MKRLPYVASPNWDRLDVMDVVQPEGMPGYGQPYMGICGYNAAMMPMIPPNPFAFNAGNMGNQYGNHNKKNKNRSKTGPQNADDKRRQTK
ncbi:hypothetical protein STCU_09936 [Strigomonas culicis]|uniref:Uncharacterized protein n=1 Tax=Strigomonas culicis TaxID=28005 RepID=S9V6E5_9TRYP|nr:hypothetical protein STCU_09936 [Strigomonas culicis]|eukprot:EPY18490.1 hypothetical protein STCU_09936 [Strigomonas culicis]